MRPTIPVSNPKANYAAHKEEIDDAIHAVLDGGQYVMGDAVEAFEEQFAAYIGVRYAIGVASGTDAIEMILRALGIGEGDEVLTVPNTATATVAPIAMVGATPRFTGVESRAMTMDPNQAWETNSHTKAVIPVHLYGNACSKMALIKQRSDFHGMHLIEDACQAHGSESGGKKVGSFGIAGAFSFYPTKNLSCFGDGGAITTDNHILASKLRSMRFYDWDSNKSAQSVCGQSRLDSMQAAVLSVKLKYLDAENDRRRAIATMYTDALKDLVVGSPRHNVGNWHVECLPLRQGRGHVFHQFVLRSYKASDFRKHLRESGVETACHYPTMVSNQFAYKQNNRFDDWASRLVSLPMYPELSDTEIEHVIESVLSFVPREVR